MNDTICALATAQGVGAIAVIRVSGSKTFEIMAHVFKSKNLETVPSHTLHFGLIKDEHQIIDEVLVSVFKNPRSYTKEDSVEISCHGSDYIVQKIIKLLLKHGCRLANPGEFTERAFLNGQLDLAQAEAVADLIAADSESLHLSAIHQIRGGFSLQIKDLREKLINFASLIELELDFGEEDVQFADRDDLKHLIHRILNVLTPLIESFEMGNVVKEGVNTVILGKPNVGKSTLLNALLNEERAIVSEIAGTTRDVIEDVIVIEGIKFRMIDTAGLRVTTDKIEEIGVQRAMEQLDKANIVLLIIDPTQITKEQALIQKQEISQANKKVFLIGNKMDIVNEETRNSFEESLGVIHWISAINKTNIDALKSNLVKNVLGLKSQNSGTMITNLRHFHHLTQTKATLEKVLEGLGHNLSGDFLAMDIRFALQSLGAITGQITTDDLLKNIFSKFCIGK